jgi:hypothetical protein
MSYIGMCRIAKLSRLIYSSQELRTVLYFLRGVTRESPNLWFIVHMGISGLAKISRFFTSLLKYVKMSIGLSNKRPIGLSIQSSHRFFASEHQVLILSFSILTKAGKGKILPYLCVTLTVLASKVLRLGVLRSFYSRSKQFLT